MTVCVTRLRPCLPGGGSPYDASIEYYRLAAHPHFILIEYILIVGMILGGMNFLIHYRLMKGDWKALGDNTEMRYWWGLIAGFTVLINSFQLNAYLWAFIGKAPMIF